MRTRWRGFFLFHLYALLSALFFWIYAGLAEVLPEHFYHCFMHDVLHLYCPLCGGTRAFSKLLTLSVVEAFSLNPAVLLAALIALALDLRAFFLLLRGSSAPLLPSRLVLLAVSYFVGYTVLLNSALLFGFDLVGDLAHFWNGLSTVRATLASLLLLLTGVSLVGALFLHERSLRTLLGFFCGYAVLLGLSVLYPHLALCLSSIFVLLGFVLFAVLADHRSAKGGFL
ncbi:MAG: DUF2752 domain-containing protein [Ruminococcaceae bacterium]|nr:DUF2752 domain-containing protein [Oscillospiraceae bacterium]